LKYRSIYIVRLVKYRRLKWAGDAARMWETGYVYRISVGKPLEKGHFED
jgi:hypothetical protein